MEATDRVEEEWCLQVVEETTEEAGTLEPEGRIYYEFDEVEAQWEMEVEREMEIEPFPWWRYRLILLGVSSGVMLTQCLF